MKQAHCFLKALCSVLNGLFNIVMGFHHHTDSIRDRTLRVDTSEGLSTHLRD